MSRSPAFRHRRLTRCPGSRACRVGRLELPPPAQPDGDDPSAASGEKAAAKDPQALSLDLLRIERGTVVYRDAATGSVQRLENLTADNERILKEARAERETLLKEARELKTKMISDAKDEAKEAAATTLSANRCQQYFAVSRMACKG